MVAPKLGFGLGGGEEVRLRGCLVMELANSGWWGFNGSLLGVFRQTSEDTCLLLSFEEKSCTDNYMLQRRLLGSYVRLTVVAMYKMQILDLSPSDYRVR